MRTTVLNHFHTFHPEAQAEFDRLVKEESRLTLALARRGEVDVDEAQPKQRMSEKAPDLDADLAKVREQMEEQRRIIASGVVRIVIKGLTRGEYRRLLIEHGPREDDDLDQRMGYNVDTFGDALIQACITDAFALGPDGEHGPRISIAWDEWADQMTNGQWDEVFRACLKLTNDPSPSLPQ